jgi:DNA-binding NarL/FixJ family response regulator
MHDEPGVRRAAMGADADTFILKRAIVTDLLPALDAVEAGGSYFSPDTADSP